MTRLAIVRGSFVPVFIQAAVVCALVIGTSVTRIVAQESVCTVVRIEIDQQLTLERQAFEAKMTIRNGSPIVPMQNLKIDLSFADKNGNAVGFSDTTTNAPPDVKFFYQLSSGGVPLTVPAGSTNTIKWLIIPAPGAGGATPDGEMYNVGATISYSAAETPQVIKCSPDYIFVKPMPSLVLDYFMPEQVYGSDTFTGSRIDPPVPFSVGVRVRNLGSNTAHNVTITTADPKVIANAVGAAASVQLQQTSVNDQSAAASYTAKVGDVAPGKAALARWLMTSALSGTLTELSGTYSHADELGGNITSLIKDTTQQFLVHDVLVDLPGRDSIRDFLATSKNGTTLKVYESDNVDTAVTTLDATLSSTIDGYLLKPSEVQGSYFLYLRQPCAPTDQQVLRVVRQDGKVLPLANAWVSKTRVTASSSWNYFINVFDVNNSLGLSYTITLGTVSSDSAHAPQFAPLSDRVVKVGANLCFNVQVTDPDGSSPILSGLLLPSKATFSLIENLSTKGVTCKQFSWTPTTNQIGFFKLTFTASDGVFSTSTNINITVTDKPPIDAWKSRYWPEGTPDSITRNQADPDGDGLSNLMEYALGLDPTRPDASGKPKIAVESNGTNSFLTMTFVGRTDDTNLTFKVIGSNSLKLPETSWSVLTNITTSTQGVAEGMQRWKAWDGVPVTNAVRRFLKLRVEYPDTTP